MQLKCHDLRNHSVRKPVNYLQVLIAGTSIKPYTGNLISKHTVRLINMRTQNRLYDCFVRAVCTTSTISTNLFSLPPCIMCKYEEIVFGTKI